MASVFFADRPPEVFDVEDIAADGAAAADVGGVAAEDRHGRGRGKAADDFGGCERLAVVVAGEIVEQDGRRSAEGGDAVDERGLGRGMQIGYRDLVGEWCKPERHLPEETLLGFGVAEHHV